MTPASFRCAILAVGLFTLSSYAAPDEIQSEVPLTFSIRVDAPKTSEADQILIDLVTGPAGLKEKTFTKGEYKLVRTAYTKYFEAQYIPAIKTALGEDAEPLLTWLDKNVEVKETLFTAIDPVVEDPAKVMLVFRDLWKADEEAVKKNDELATAVSVVWDNTRGVFDYKNFQLTTKSTLPESVMKIGAIDNFKYVLDRQTKLKGPQLQLPWEFLVHVVNHRTPIDERDWASTKYLKRRTGIGSVYKDVEYDYVMLKTKYSVCKLNDKPYTLPSIREHGGVCAMQADFAARVGKSLLVPAEYIAGEGNSGLRHAWVMWVEVKAVKKDAVTFTLESYRRV